MRADYIKGQSVLATRTDKDSEFIVKEHKVHNYRINDGIKVKKCRKQYLTRLLELSTVVDANPCVDHAYRYEAAKGQAK